MAYKRYKMLQKYVNGVAQEEYKQGELISDYEYDTFNECNEGNQNPDEDIEDFIYQWVVVSGTYVCNGTNKHQEEKEQRSSDNGVTWEDTGNTRRGSLIEADSVDCGYANQYLTFVALEDGTFSFTRNDIQYSLDNGTTWQTLTAESSTPTVTSGNKIMWKVENPTIASRNGIGTFSSTGRFDVKGNIMSLFYGDNFANQTSLSGKTDAFFFLFKNNANLINSNNLLLPATTLAQGCYEYMFQNCTSLITAPQLSARTLSRECYRGMFYECTSLATAPVLPATSLSISCYSDMFRGCTSLVNAPVLSATTLKSSCYYQMFYGCTSLTTAPELPATTLTSQCYGEMFRSCTNLNYIKAMFTTTPSSTYTSNWVDGVSATGTFVKNSAASWDVRGTSGIPNGWTVQTASS